MTVRCRARRAVGVLSVTAFATGTALALAVPAAGATAGPAAQPAPAVQATGKVGGVATATAAPTTPSATRTSAAPTATATRTYQPVRTSPPATVRRLATQAPQAAATDGLDNGPTGAVPSATFIVGQVPEQSLDDVSNAPAPSLSAVAASSGGGTGDTIRRDLIIALCVCVLLCAAGVGGVLATRKPDLVGDAAGYRDRSDRGGRHRRRR